MKKRFKSVTLVQLAITSLAIFISLAVGVSIKKRAADQVALFVKRMVLSGDIRQAVLTLVEFSSEKFDEIVYLDAAGKRVFSTIDDKLSQKKSLIFSLWRISRKISLTDDSQKVFGRVVFFYSPIDFVPLFVVLYILFFLITVIFMRTHSFNEALKLNVKIKEENLENVSLLARQVAHDIRSPLTALEMALSDVSQLPADRRELVKMATQRIHDIANNLLKKDESLSHDVSGSGADESQLGSASPQLIYSVIDQIISEKRLQFRAKMQISIESDISPDAYGLFSKVNSSELSRVLSNLINNSVEAIEKAGRVSVGLKKLDENCMCIFVEDDGCGIPQESLHKIGVKGFSRGKEVGDSGSGLGVFHAKQTIEAWGGELKIESQVGKGSLFSLILPTVSPPEWFVGELTVKNTCRVVVLDDDVSIHQTWEERLKGEGFNNSQNVIHLFSEYDFLKWLREKKDDDLLLCDYEIIGGTKNGVELIKENQIAKQSVLVTSRFSDQQVIEDCERYSIKCLPKELAGLAPVKVV